MVLNDRLVEIKFEFSVSPLSTNFLYRKGDGNKKTFLENVEAAQILALTLLESENH